ncbi:MAG: metal ABC transporter substrate-binding protein [Chloroflexota bacterium]
MELPALSPIELDGRPLRVVATTSIIGDVVSQVGGDAIELTTLMGPGQDPHSYEPAAADLTAVANADVIFVNGWDLEEALVSNLANIGEGVAIVPVSAGIEPLPFGEDEHEHEHEGEEEHEGEADHEHEHGAADPHTWLDVSNVKQWTSNIATALSALDETHADLFAENAAGYEAELTALDTEVREQLATIPENRRVLVTNHDAFGYFAHAYGFEILGTIIPGASTLAEPTASDLTDLINDMQQEGVCSIFSESTVSDRLGQTVASELSGCDNVQVLQLYTGAIGPEGSGADSYIGMMRANVDTIVSGLT